jgi:carbon monoxide dehydrogenase subunit G
VNVHTVRCELFGGFAAVPVPTERREEVDLRPQLGQHARNDTPAAGRAGERAVGVDDGARPGEVLDRDEVNPLDVSDYRDARHRGERILRAMAPLTGTSTEEIEAPLGQVWELVADVERAPDWQGGLDSVRAFEHDDEGRATLCETETDAKVRKIKTVVRFSYEPPTTLRWTQEKGDLKAVVGSWELEDLGGDRTRATYRVEADLGRVLGMVVRGPLVDVLRHVLAGARAGELKKAIEG